MAGMFSARLVGAPEMKAALIEVGGFLSTPVIRNAVRRAMLKCAEPIADAMRAAAPRAATGRTVKQLPDAVGVFSRLSASQRKDIGKATYNVRSGNTAANRSNSVTVYVGVSSGKPTLIGVWQEFGTDERITKDGKSTGQVQPHPFVRPAFEAGAATYFDRLAPMIRVEIDKAAKRAAAKSLRAAKKAAAGK